jgi:hypothetical protein
MTEQQYVDVSDRVRLGNALKILHEIIPENSSIVTTLEFDKIVQQLWKWEQKLFKVIKIREK